MKRKFWKRVWNFYSDNRKSKIQNLKWGWLVALVVAFANCGVVGETQQKAKAPKIGWLSQGSVFSVAPQREAIRSRLRELGYVEDKNIAFDYRYAENKLDRLPALANELVRQKVDVLLVSSPY